MDDLVTQLVRAKRQRMTHSRLAAYRACPRKHRYMFTLGYRRRRVASALRVGTIIHLALEVYWRARQRGAPQDEWLPAALAAITRDLDVYERARIGAMMVGYAAVWNERGVRVRHVELQYRAPLRDPVTEERSALFDAAGKMDVVMDVEKQGAWTGYVTEHKSSATRAAPGSPYRAQLALNGQIDQYLAAAEGLKLGADFVLYDVLVKPKIKPLLATPESKRKYTKGTKTLYAKQRLADETPRAYYDRLLATIRKAPLDCFQQVPVARGEADRMEYRYDVWQYAEMIARSEATGIAPKNTDACFKFGEPCEYWPVCSGTASIEDDALYRRKLSADEELDDESDDDESDDDEPDDDEPDDDEPETDNDEED